MLLTTSSSSSSWNRNCMGDGELQNVVQELQVLLPDSQPGLLLLHSGCNVLLAPQEEVTPQRTSSTAPAAGVAEERTAASAAPPEDPSVCTLMTAVLPVVVFPSGDMAAEVEEKLQLLTPAAAHQMLIHLGLLLDFEGNVERPAAAAAANGRGAGFKAVVQGCQVPAAAAVQQAVLVGNQVSNCSGSRCKPAAGQQREVLSGCRTAVKTGQHPVWEGCKTTADVAWLCLRLLHLTEHCGQFAGAVSWCVLVVAAQQAACSSGNCCSLTSWTQ